MGKSTAIFLPEWVPHTLPGSFEDAHAERAAALEFLLGRGLPTQREESWRFTPLKTLSQLPQTSQLNEISLRGPLLSEARLWMVCGLDIMAAPTGLPPAPRVAAEILNHSVRALNRALSITGLNLTATPDGPAHHEVVQLADPRHPAAHVHHRLHVTAGTQLILLERVTGPVPALFTTAWDITLEEGATLTHLRLQDTPTSAQCLGHSAVNIAARARYEHFTLSTGAALSRHEIHAQLNGPGAHVTLSGAYAISGEQLCDTTTHITHAAPECTSRQIIHGAMDGRAQGVFQGKITVAPDAQKTDGHQLNRALLLSDQAGINSKPELEIFADDVKCSHGATVGDLDAQSLFYLLSRGITKDQARALLLESYLKQPLTDCADDTLRAIAEKWLSEKLHAESL